MSFLSTLNTVISKAQNPFIREIAHGVAGAIKGQTGADLVDKGFKLFDGIVSAFEQFKSPTTAPAATTSSLKDPRAVQSLTASSSAASTSAPETSSSSSASTAATSSSKSAATASSDNNASVGGLASSAL